MDSNVLLRSLFAGMNDHEACRTTLNRLQQEDNELWISHQIVREFCVNATHERTFSREGAPRPHHDRVLEVVAWLPARFTVADVDVDVHREFFKIMREYRVVGKQLHDANIVATMLVHDINTLLTRNFRHFTRYQEVVKLLSPTQDVAH